MAEWTIDPDLVRILSPLALAHSAIGLTIVGVVMWMRSDSTLKLFGVGMGLFALGLAVGAITMVIRPPEGSITWFGIVGGLLTLAAVLVFLRVGVEDWSHNWKRNAMVGGVVWVIVAFALELTLDAGSQAYYTDGGFIVSELHAVTVMWIVVGLVFAFFEAAHIAVEHSHGEPYRSIVLGAMSVMAMSLVVTTAAGWDALRFINMLAGTIAVGVMWIAVLLHERREIAAERGSGG